MIGLVLVTHGNLAKEFVSVMEHIVGPQKQIAVVCMMPDDDMDLKRKEIIKRVKSVDSGKGVLILTDMFGGTPSNLAISFTQDKKIEVLAGVNLPMLIKLASVRDTEDLQQAATSGQEAARKYINVASALLNTP
ncbi:MAG: PTS sugar transporter subunit IIA [Alphaproteobacteria bacterium]|nr:PTS sugar transporter subunit IIA [Alphaproteobacteria bacterium]MCK5518052.1 PTS sugar transporter subunit IIA [Alphaproteobacteria bacterium]MCK5555618.1 PTS sugar transporter subunit IIA [Alphaproteobacteria bacterium]